MHNPKSYIQLRFSRSDDDELIQAFISDFSSLGILDEEDSWSCYFSVHDWSTAVQRPFTDGLKNRFPFCSFETFVFEEENWNQTWENSITPLRVSERFIITPSWHQVDAHAGTEVLIIDPKMSFGTGFHATTRLMLRLLEKTIEGGERVLDVGTGTGVLAIAAVKLGAKYAEGVDTDEWSFENAMENCERNRVVEQITMMHGSIECAANMYDVVCSNITKNDNIALLPAFNQRLRSNGIAILSGFYSTELDDVLEFAARSEFEFIDSISEDEWIAIRIRTSAESKNDKTPE